MKRLSLLLVLGICLGRADAAEVDDSVPQSYVQRAVEELKARDYEAALKDSTRAMDLGFRKTSAFNARSAALTGLGRFKEALVDADVSINYNPGGAAGYLNRAAAREGLSRPKEEILADYKKAAELDRRWTKLYEEAEKKYAHGEAEMKRAREPQVRAQPTPKASAAVPLAAVAVKNDKPAPVAVKVVEKEVKKEEPAAVEPVAVSSPAAVSIPAQAPPIEVKLAAPARSYSKWAVFKKALAALLVVAVGIVLRMLWLVPWRVRGTTRHVRFGTVLRTPLDSSGEARAGSVVGGRYILGQPAGHDGTADVFEGRDLEDRPRLIERVPKRAELSERAKAAQSLRHPAIVPLEAAFEQGGWLYLVFESSAGETLRRSLDRKPERRLSAAAALRVLQPAADALDHAHGKGVFHGHLSPAQMLVDAAGVKVKGFGLPADAGDAPYLAPEQEAGPASAPADVFALGACLFEILTGQKPFAGAGDAQAKRERRYPRASTLTKGLPEGIDDFFTRALEPDPERRFRAAGELAGAFRALAVPGVH